jgi:hypothetical protein
MNISKLSRVDFQVLGLFNVGPVRVGPEGLERPASLKELAAALVDPDKTHPAPEFQERMLLNVLAPWFKAEEQRRITHAEELWRTSAFKFNSVMGDFESPKVTMTGPELDQKMPFHGVIKPYAVLPARMSLTEFAGLAMTTSSISECMGAELQAWLSTEVLATNSEARIMDALGWELVDRLKTTYDGKPPRGAIGELVRKLLLEANLEPTPKRVKRLTRKRHTLRESGAR